MGPRAPTDPPKFIPQKWVPKWDPKWAHGHGTCPTWAWDMPNLAWDMPNLAWDGPNLAWDMPNLGMGHAQTGMGHAQPGMGHAHCPWSMDMPNQIGPERPRDQQLGPNGPGSNNCVFGTAANNDVVIDINDISMAF